jgi:hypothetical protein
MSERPNCTVSQRVREKIRDRLVIDEPDESFVDALEGAVRITNQTWRVLPTDGIWKRRSQDRVFTYLLAQYAASRLSGREVPMFVTRAELYDHFDRATVKQVCEHDWVRNWDGKLQIEPNALFDTAEVLADLYGGDDGAE